MGDKHHEADTKLFHLVGLILITLHSLSLEFHAGIQYIVEEICHLSAVVSSDLVVLHLYSSKAVVPGNGY